MQGACRCSLCRARRYRCCGYPYPYPYPCPYPCRHALTRRVVARAKEAADLADVIVQEELQVHEALRAQMC